MGRLLNTFGMDRAVASAAQWGVCFIFLAWAPFCLRLPYGRAVDMFEMGVCMFGSVRLPQLFGSTLTKVLKNKSRVLKTNIAHFLSGPQAPESTENK